MQKKLILIFLLRTILHALYFYFDSFELHFKGVFGFKNFQDNWVQFIVPIKLRYSGDLKNGLVVYSKGPK